MVKHNDQWGTVCDDGFETKDAQAACYTLGYSGGSYTTYSEDGPEGPIWMDDVTCSSGTTNFLMCRHSGWGRQNCDHSEDVLLTCS